MFLVLVGMKRNKSSKLSSTIHEDHDYEHLFICTYTNIPCTKRMNLIFQNERVSGLLHELLFQGL